MLNRSLRPALRAALLAPVLVAALGAAMFASPAHAQNSTSEPPQAAPVSSPPAAVASVRGDGAPALTGPSVLVLGEFFYGYTGVGIGGRYMIPLAIPSLLGRTNLRDSWALEPGIDFIHRSDNYGIYNYSYSEIVPTVGMMWLVWLTPEFAVYPKIEAGWAFGFSSSNSCAGCDVGGVYTEATAGLLYRISGLTLRAELGSYGPKGGLAWFF